MLNKLIFGSVLFFSTLSLAQKSEPQIHWDNVIVCMELKHMKVGPVFPSDNDIIDNVIQENCDNEEMDQAIQTAQFRARKLLDAAKK